MKIKFIGDLQGLEAGIKELAGILDIDLADGGYTVSAVKKEGSDLIVSLDGKEGSITYSERCHFFRGLGLMVEQLKDEKVPFTLTEVPQFKMNGPMFDVSQGNAAFNIKTVKHIIRQIALMGLNMLMIYCEDSFEVKKQPYFGYMRAKYTEAEMRELDDYADALGVEMIPCIQTLAHMPDTLHWKVYDNIRDYAECLLVGKDETYEYVRDLIEAAARPFRTKKIHIGMDEAWALGRGKYIDTFGYSEPFPIMKEHLSRVMAIVNDLGLEPMMWDDMFFRAVNIHDYHNLEGELPREATEIVPDGMRCVYWDYYTLEQESYEKMIPIHKGLDKDLIFAGGCWTWVGFSLGWTKTLITTEAALNACKNQGVKNVFMTVWGDNGTECLANTTLIGCQLFAEHGYAEKFDYGKFKKRFRFCTGGCAEDFEKLELLDRNPLTCDLSDHSEYNASKYLMWQDILTGLADKNIEGLELDAHYTALKEDFKAAIGRNGQFDSMFTYNYHVADVLSKKSQMGLRLTAAYKEGNREALRNFAEVELPDLKKRVAELRSVHMENWFAIYKAFGWDIMDMRYGSLQTRIDSAIQEIGMYLDGKLEKLEELEEERLFYDGKPGPIRYLNFYGQVVSPSRIAPLA